MAHQAFFPSMFKDATARLARLTNSFAGVSDVSASPAPGDTSINTLPVEVLEQIIAHCLALEPADVFLSSAAESTPHAQTAAMLCRRRAAFPQVASVCKLWRELARRQLSRTIRYRPSTFREPGMDLADRLEGDEEWAARVHEVVIDLAYDDFNTTNAGWMNNGMQPLLDMQRAGAEACLACPNLAHVTILRGQPKRRHRLNGGVWVPASLPLTQVDSNLVDAVATRSRLTSLALHPVVSYLDLQIVSLCSWTLSELSLTVASDLREQPPAWPGDGVATPRPPSHRLRHLVLTLSGDGCIRSADLLRLLGEDPALLCRLELRLDPPREDHRHVVPVWGMLAEMILSRCTALTELTIADIGVISSVSVGDATAKCQDAIHALAQLQTLTLSRLRFFPDVFLLVCDTLLSQLDTPSYTDPRSSPPRSMWSSSPLASETFPVSAGDDDDLFGYLDADGSPNPALRATMERLGPLPKRVRLDDAGAWSTTQRKALVERCSRLGVILEASWDVAGGRSPKARARSPVSG